MCTMWAALFLFLSLSVSVPLSHPPRLPSFVVPLLYPSVLFLSSLNLVLFFFLPRVASPVLPGLFVFVRPFLVRRLPLVISSSFARSRFFSRFSFTVPRFFLSFTPVHYPSFVRPPPPARLFSSIPPPPPPSPPPSFSHPSLYIPPRAASVETARFFPPVSSAPTFFYTFFLPPPVAAHAPLPRHRNTASSIHSVSLSLVSHIRT